jgi:hypothetical protein
MTMSHPIETQSLLAAPKRVIIPVVAAVAAMAEASEGMEADPRPTHSIHEFMANEDEGLLLLLLGRNSVRTPVHCATLPGEQPRKSIGKDSLGGEPGGLGNQAAGGLRGEGRGEARLPRPAPLSQAAGAGDTSSLGSPPARPFLSFHGPGCTFVTGVGEGAERWHSFFPLCA